VISTAPALDARTLQLELDQAWRAFFSLNGASWDIQGPAAKQVLALRQQLIALGVEPR